jgi:hypothetical protein
MRTVLVPFDGTRYLAVDKVALARRATALLPLVPTATVSDDYGLDGTLRPLLGRAIAYQVDSPILERAGIIGGRYFWERREGTLPEAFSPEFDASLSRFLVVAMSMPLEEPKLETIEGKVWAAMQMEDIVNESDEGRHE